MKTYYKQLSVLALGLFCLTLAVPQAACAAGGAHIVWNYKDVTITDGCCEVRIAFTNDGDMAAEMTQAEMTVDVTYNGKVLFSVYKKFDLYGMYVWGGAPQHTFVSPIAAPRTSHHHQSPKVQTGLSVFLLNKYGVPLIVFAQQTQHFLPLAWKKDNNV